MINMEIIHKCCAGLDIHKKEIVACVLTSTDKEVEKFGTMTDEILRMADWLMDRSCTHVAMESTGVYWKPVYNLLEGTGMEVMVVNAHHIKTVPGRKTDVNDAEWIAKLLRHGLVRGSFVPDKSQRELRELTRYRRALVQERTREVNRIQKVLEGANIKLSSVATDVLGKSGRAMISNLVSGNDDPVYLSGLAKGQLKKKKDLLERSLRGLMGSHQRLLLGEQLSHIEELERRIERLSKEIEERMRPFSEQIQLLDQVIGINQRAAEDILAETGVDMSRFPSAKHLASWCGICPGNNESAGKQKSGKSRPGNRWLRVSLVQAARAASLSKGSYLSTQYHRIASRRGGNRAAIAVAHSILVIIYNMLSTGKDYIDMGADFFDRRSEESLIRRTTKRIESLGYNVSIEKIAS
jgi:transposase